MKISQHVSWIGKIDWELRKFHGEQLSTYHGSSYNAYLIEDEKTAVIDTVWLPFADEYIANLKKKIDLTKLDYIIVNHAEPDHSGALPLLVREAPQAKVICTASGIKSIKGYYHQDWNFQTVKTGEKLNLGQTELTFIEAPLLHWPDTLMSYLSGDDILFSSDVFGQHYASETLIDENIDTNELYYEAIKYFANIIAPYAKKTVKKIEELQGMNLPLKMIAPAHGVLWKNDTKTIIQKYIDWSNAYSENQITLVYDTMYNSTRRMAEIIASGIVEEDPSVVVKLFNSARHDNSDILTELFKSKAMLVGSPSYNNGILKSTAGIIEEIKGMEPKQKKAAAFGSYGWSPANVKIIAELLKECGLEVFETTAKAAWNPNEDDATKLKEFGREFVKFVNQ